jgi:hypothetical protein
MIKECSVVPIVLSQEVSCWENNCCCGSDISNQIHSKKKSRRNYSNLCKYCQVQQQQQHKQMMVADVRLQPPQRKKSCSDLSDEFFTSDMSTEFGIDDIPVKRRSCILSKSSADSVTCTKQKTTKGVRFGGLMVRSIP